MWVPTREVTLTWNWVCYFGAAIWMKLDFFFFRFLPQIYTVLWIFYSWKKRQVEFDYIHKTHFLLCFWRWSIVILLIKPSVTELHLQHKPFYKLCIYLGTDLKSLAPSSKDCYQNPKCWDDEDRHIPATEWPHSLADSRFRERPCLKI